MRVGQQDTPRGRVCKGRRQAAARFARMPIAAAVEIHRWRRCGRCQRARPPGLLGIVSAALIRMPPWVPSRRVWDRLGTRLESSEPRFPRATSNERQVRDRHAVLLQEHVGRVVWGDRGGGRTQSGGSAPTASVPRGGPARGRDWAPDGRHVPRVLGFREPPTLVHHPFPSPRRSVRLRNPYLARCEITLQRASFRRRFISPQGSGRGTRCAQRSCCSR